MQQSHSSLITVSDSASCSLLRRASLQSILLSDPSFHLKFSELIFKIEIKKNPLTLVDEYWGVKNDLIIKLNSSKNFDDNPNLVKLNEFQQLFFDYVVNMIFPNDLNQSSSVEVIEDQRVKLKFKIINQIFLDDSESVITLQKVADCDLGFNNFWKIDYPSNPVIFLYNPDNQNKPLTIYLSQDFISLYNPINDGDGVKSKIKCPTTRSIIDIDNSKIVFFVSSSNLDFRIIKLKDYMNYILNKPLL